MKKVAISLILVLLTVPILSYALKCPEGAYYGRDNNGNEACRDLKTNKVVDANTGIPIGETDVGSYGWVGVGIVILIIIIAVAVRSRKPKEIEYKDIQRMGFSHNTKELVKERQDGRCAICRRIPTHWEFDHIGSRGDNSVGNCQGLCRDCHQDKTLGENR